MCVAMQAVTAILPGLAIGLLVVLSIVTIFGLW
jgi:hypothetical protein